MSWFPVLASRIRGFVFKRRLRELELDEELRVHTEIGPRRTCGRV
jgi:hypothetical protein